MCRSQIGNNGEEWDVLAEFSADFSRLDQWAIIHRWMHRNDYIWVKRFDAILDCCPTHQFGMKVRHNLVYFVIRGMKKKAPLSWV
jgi:hypothetical protein